MCSICKSSFFVGNRYECLTCQNFNLCQQCLPETNHQHEFKEHIKPQEIVFDLCYEGNLEKLKSFSYLNFFDNVGWTCTNYAAEGGQVHVLKWLKKQGFDMNHKSLDGYTPMLCACYNGHLETVKWLHEEGCSIFEFESKKYSCIMYACFNGHLDVVKYLIKSGCSLSEKAHDGYTAVHCAAESGHVDILAYLFLNGVDMNVKANDGYTPLLSAVHQNHLSVVIWLVNHGVDIYETTSDGLHAFYLAIECSNYRIAKWLMANTDLATRNYIESHHATPLMLAACSGQLEFVYYLLSKGFSLDETSVVGCTPLKASIITGNLNSIIYLQKHGSSFKEVNKITGTTTLTCAAKFKQIHILQYLLFHGGNYQEVMEDLKEQVEIFQLYKKSIHYEIQEKNYEKLGQYKYEDDFLHNIVMSGDVEMLKVFVDKDFEKLKSFDKFGDSVLNTSIIYDEFEIFKFLYSLKVMDLSVKNCENLTTFDIALRKGNLEILSSFIPYQKNVEHASNTYLLLQ
eukprot:gene2379-2844_t